MTVHVGGPGVYSEPPPTHLTCAKTMWKVGKVMGVMEETVAGERES